MADAYETIFVINHEKIITAHFVVGLGFLILRPGLSDHSCR